MFAAVRSATIGDSHSAVNTHPFALGRLLVQHVGGVAGFWHLLPLLTRRIPKDLQHAIWGQSDTELLGVMLLGELRTRHRRRYGLPVVDDDVAGDAATPGSGALTHQAADDRPLLDAFGPGDHPIVLSDMVAATRAVLDAVVDTRPHVAAGSIEPDGHVHRRKAHLCGSDAQEARLWHYPRVPAATTHGVAPAPDRWAADLNIAVSDGDRVVATRFRTCPDQEPPPMYYGLGSGWHAGAGSLVHPVTDRLPVTLTTGRVVAGDTAASVPRRKGTPMMLVVTTQPLNWDADQWHLMPKDSLLAWERNADGALPVLQCLSSTCDEEVSSGVVHSCGTLDRMWLVAGDLTSVFVLLSLALLVWAVQRSLALIQGAERLPRRPPALPAGALPHRDLTA